MKIKLMLLFSLAFSISCARHNDRQQGTIDDALRPYLDKFISVARANKLDLDTFNLTMFFSNVMPPSEVPNTTVAAYCHVDSQGKYVIVKTSHWNAIVVPSREQIIFHELGHCLLGLKHDDSIQKAYDYYGVNLYNSYAPHSIMNSIQIDILWYSTNRAAYINQLFNPDSPFTIYYYAPSQFGPHEYE